MAGDTFTVAQPSLPLGDPHICSDSRDRLSLIVAVYEALVSRDEPGVFRPSLAEAWRVGHDARVWEFRLRRGVLFHDGHELRAGDVVASLERIRSPKVGGALGTQGIYASYLGGAELEAVGVDRVRVALREPMADLLELLVEMPITPEEALDDLPHEHVGSGPYMVNDLDEDEVNMIQHPRHWRGKPAHRRLLWRTEPDEAERVRAVAAGEADVASGLTAEGRASADSAGIHVDGLLGGLCVIYLLNCSYGPCRD